MYLFLSSIYPFLPGIKVPLVQNYLPQKYPSWELLKHSWKQKRKTKQNNEQKKSRS